MRDNNACPHLTRVNIEILTTECLFFFFLLSGLWRGKGCCWVVTLTRAVETGYIIGFRVELKSLIQVRRHGLHCPTDRGFPGNTPFDLVALGSRGFLSVYMIWFSQVDICGV